MDTQQIALMWQMIVLSLAGFLAGLAITVAVQFFRAWRKNHISNNLLPWHVFSLMSSYVMLLSYATAETMLRIHEHASNTPTWRSVFLVPAYVLGVIGMWTIMKYRRRHLK